MRRFETTGCTDEYHHRPPKQADLIKKGVRIDLYQSETIWTISIDSEAFVRSLLTQINAIPSEMVQMVSDRYESILTPFLSNPLVLGQSGPFGAFVGAEFVGGASEEHS